MSKSVVRASAAVTDVSAIVSSNSSPLLMNHYEHSFKAGFGVDLKTEGSGGGATYTVQFTFDDPGNTNAVWFDHALSAQTADARGAIDFPVNALRVQVQACAETTGTVGAIADLMVLQAGDMRYEPRSDPEIFQGPLDGIGSYVRQAYSYRRLLASYTANKAITISRSVSAIADVVDSQATVFGFDDGGRLDTAAIDVFVTASSTGYIKTWFDQKGDRDLFALLTAERPVYEATDSSFVKPGANFADATNARLLSSANSFNTFMTQGGAVNIVAETSTDGGFANKRLFSMGSSPGFELKITLQSAGGYHLGNTMAPVGTTAGNPSWRDSDTVLVSGTGYSWWWEWDGRFDTNAALDASNVIFVDNSSQDIAIVTSGQPTSATGVSTKVAFGARVDAAAGFFTWDGIIHEAILFNSFVPTQAASAFREDQVNFWNKGG